MAYGIEAQSRRRCTGTTKAGEPCRAWGVWDDPRRLCGSHAGRNRGPFGRERKSEKTHYAPCRCAAYNWPHRPGGGLCRWPDEPLFRCTIPTGTKAWWRP